MDPVTSEQAMRGLESTELVDHEQEARGVVSSLAFGGVVDVLHRGVELRDEICVLSSQWLLWHVRSILPAVTVRSESRSEWIDAHTLYRYRADFAGRSKLEGDADRVTDEVTPNRTTEARSERCGIAHGDASVNGSDYIDSRRKSSALRRRAGLCWTWCGRGAGAQGATARSYGTGMGQGCRGCADRSSPRSVLRGG